MDAHQLIQVKQNSKVPAFRPGDTVRVNFRIREGERERLQAFQGVVIRKRGSGPGASFTVRQVSHGIGVERIFPSYSPLIDSLTVIRHGKVRRARLYYLRERFGRAARIKERTMPKGANVLVIDAEAESTDNAVVDEAESTDDAAADEAESTDDAAADEAESTDDAAADEAESTDDAAADEAESTDDAAADEAESTDDAPIDETNEDSDQENTSKS